MYCQKCGHEVNDMAAVCLNCGCEIKRGSAQDNDSSSFGYGILAFFIPIVGLILYILWRESFPKRAKSLLTGTIIGFACSVLIAIICFILTFALPFVFLMAY